MWYGPFTRMHGERLHRARGKRQLAGRSAPWLMVFLIACSEPRYVPEDDTRISAAPEGGPGAQDAAPPDAADALRDAGRDGGPRSGDGGSGGDARSADALVQGGGSDAGGFEDASGPSGLADDAGGGATLPSWAEQLAGSYAVRSYAFADDGANVTLSEGLSIAEIRRERDGLVLVTQACRVVAINALATITVEKPETLAQRSHRMLFDGEAFSTEPNEVAEGYEARAIADCEGKLGQAIPKRPHQKWLASSCKCGADLIPKADDCRVLDPDADTLPGYTMFFRSASGLTELRIWGVQANYARFVQMVRRPDGSLVGRIDAKSGALQYDCSVSSCADLSGPTPWCSSELTVVEFVPLARRPAPVGGWSCDAVRTRDGELFPTLPPQVPARCGR